MKNTLALPCEDTHLLKIKRPGVALLVILSLIFDVFLDVRPPSFYGNLIGSIAL